jgi:hypothetical protein
MGNPRQEPDGTVYIARLRVTRKAIARLLCSSEKLLDPQPPCFAASFVLAVCRVAVPGTGRAVDIFFRSMPRAKDR